MIELKPCPKCNGEEAGCLAIELWRVPEGRYVRCIRCGFQGPNCIDLLNGRADAINAWNSLEREEDRIAKAVAEACAERDAEIEENKGWATKFFAGITMARDERDAALARIAELEAQLAKATTWQPGETAPRDGTWILVRDREDEMTHVVRWCHIYERFRTEHYTDNTIYWVNAKRWLPLPPLPTSEGGEG